MAGCRQEQAAQGAEVEGDEARSPPTSSPAQNSPPQPELLARQKLSATTLKCPGISGGANLHLWPAPLSGTRFKRSGVVASGGRVATRVCGASFLGGAVPERAWGKMWWWGNGPGAGLEPSGGSIGWLRPPERTEARSSSGALNMHHTV